MPRLFIGNFDFEHRLAYEAATLPAKLVAINASLAPAWIAIADDGDAIWSYAGFTAANLTPLAESGLPQVDFVADPKQLPERYELVFWGEDAWAVSFATALGRTWKGCDPTVVRRVNSRRWKNQLEQQLGVAPLGLAAVNSPGNLTTAIRNLPNESWVLKAEFCGAGREVRFGSGPLNQSEQNWAASRFQRGLSVLVEPRLDRLEEAGIQFQITRDGNVDFLGVTPLLTRPNGSFVGSRYEHDESLISTWQHAIETGHQVARLTAATGYFGPLGIDAMRYRAPDGTTRVRPLQDLNARYTMGRLALGLRRFLNYAAATNFTFTPQQFSTAGFASQTPNAC